MVLSERRTIDGLGEVVESTGDLVTNVRELRKYGGLISPRDEAYVRAHSGIGQSEGTRVSMVVRYLKGENSVLVKDGMTLSLARKLTEANRQGNYFDTGSSKAYDLARKIADKEEKSGKAAEERIAILCPSRDKFGMSPTENSTVLEFVFEDTAQEYFERNGSNQIAFYPIDSLVVDRAQGAIQNYLWFDGLGGRSELDGNSRFANYVDCGARGVLAVPTKAKGSAGWGSETYTPRRIRDAMERTGFSGRSIERVLRDLSGK